MNSNYLNESKNKVFNKNIDCFLNKLKLISIDLNLMDQKLIFNLKASV